MKKNSIMTLKDENGRTIEVEVLFTYNSSNNTNTYIVYTDHSKDSDGKEKVYAGIYDKDNSLLNPIENKEDYKMIENILSSIDKKVS
ncbi:MAG: DUF1292 domain-containing protein [Bacilli bacterium]|nr:DUF1292 domain-containing protein [Bacilli bacterium]